MATVSNHYFQYKLDAFFGCIFSKSYLFYMFESLFLSASEEVFNETCNIRNASGSGVQHSNIMVPQHFDFIVVFIHCIFIKFVTIIYSFILNLKENRFSYAEQVACLLRHA